MLFDGTAMVLAEWVDGTIAARSDRLRGCVGASLVAANDHSVRSNAELAAALGSLGDGGGDLKLQFRRPTPDTAVDDGGEPAA
eukprot:gene54996-51879_t